jgi:hypothetical protein
MKSLDISLLDPVSDHVDRGEEGVAIFFTRFGQPRIDFAAAIYPSLTVTATALTQATLISIFLLAPNDGNLRQTCLCFDYSIRFSTFSHFDKIDFV